MASIGLSGPLHGYRPTRCDEGDLLRLGFGPLLPVTYQQPLGSLAWAKTNSTDSASSSSQRTTLWAKASLRAWARGAFPVCEEGLQPPARDRPA